MEIRYLRHKAASRFNSFCLCHRLFRYEINKETIECTIEYPFYRKTWANPTVGNNMNGPAVHNQSEISLEQRKKHHMISILTRYENIFTQRNEQNSSYQQPRGNIKGMTEKDGLMRVKSQEDGRNHMYSVQTTKFSSCGFLFHQPQIIKVGDTFSTNN